MLHPPFVLSTDKRQNRSFIQDVTPFLNNIIFQYTNPLPFGRVGGNRSKERDRKSELVLRSTYQIFEWDRNNSDRNFYDVVRYVHIPLVP